MTTITLMKPKPFILTLAVAAILLGCSGDKESKPDPSQGGGNTAKTVTVALLPKIKGIAYFSSCAEGAREAASELGNIELIYDGPTDGDPKKQAEMIESWTVDGVDVIAVSPNAPDVVANAMKEARAEGVQVITWDADAAADTRSFFVNQATAQSIGEGMINAMTKDLGPPTPKATS